MHLNMILALHVKFDFNIVFIYEITRNDIGHKLNSHCFRKFVFIGLFSGTLIYIHTYY